MSIIEKHKALIQRKLALRVSLIEEEAELSSVQARLKHLAPREPETLKANDKRRHLEMRIKGLREKLINIEAEIEQMQFEALFEE